jgi:hypothetical protein
MDNTMTLAINQLPVDRVLTEDEHVALGYDSPIPGHHLVVYSQSLWSTTFRCECGKMQLYARQTDSGKVSRAYSKDYRTHLLNLSIPYDSMTRVGSIVKTRITWDLNVFTVNHPEALMYASNQRWRNWIVEGPMNIYIWILGVEKRNNNPKGKAPTNSILGLYRSRDDAVVQALKQLDKSEQQGLKVERFIDLQAGIEAKTISVTDMLTDLVVRADTASTSTQIGMLRQMDELLSLVPIIQTKADNLRSKLNLLEGG